MYVLFLRYLPTTLIIMVMAVRLGYTAAVACKSQPSKLSDDFVTDIGGTMIKDISFYKAKKQAATPKSSIGLLNQEDNEILAKFRCLSLKNMPVSLSTFAQF